MAAALLSCALFAEAHAQSDYHMPEWVRETFEVYVDGHLSEEHLLSAISYLIDNGIIRIQPYGIADEGDFYVEYEPTSAFPDAAAYLQDTYLLEDDARWLNENYKLPYDVLIKGADCGMENAFYSLSEKSITMCYELVESIRSDGNELYPDPAVADDFAYNVLDGILLHETGHALVDVYDLPITGLEEDAVDQFSALIQSRTYDDYDPEYQAGQIMMHDVAYWWGLKADDPPVYWDVHALSIQRFYNIACYAYGADPEYNSGLVGGDYLPAGRASGCGQEYEQMASSWDRLLEGYLVE